MSELSERVQSLIVILCTSLYASRKDDEIIQESADLICTDLRRKYSNRRVTDREFRLATSLGKKIAEGGINSFTDVPAEEIMMKYEEN